MTKNQFIILMVTSVTLVILTAANLFLQVQTQRLNASAQGMQNYILQHRQVDGPLQNLVTRIASDSDKEPRLKDLLLKHGVKATLNVDGQEKQYP